jgi:ABC-type Zn uptake system ZnuABC Zn-binding protein ZnuA
MGRACADAPYLLRVVATTTQIADLARNVGGRQARVQAILSANVDPRTYALGPGDLARIALADVVLVNGVGLEDPWLAPLTRGPSGIPVAVTNRHVKVLPIDPGVGYVLTAEGFPAVVPHPGVQFAPGRTSGPNWGETVIPVAAVSRGVALIAGDPAVWSAVPNAIRMVANIRDAFSAAAGPSYAEYYESNAARYLAALEILDRSIAGQIATLTRAQRTLVTNSGILDYYARRYGLRLVRIAVPGTTAGPAAAAREMDALAATIRAAHTKAVFLDGPIDPAAIQAIGRAARVRVVTDLYGMSLGLPGSDGDTYVTMMQHNTDVIVGALR